MTPESVRQERIALANLKAQRARELIDEITRIKATILKEFPVNTFGYTKSQISKRTSFENLFTHLTQFIRHPNCLIDHYRHEDEEEKRRLEEEQRKKHAAKQEEVIQKYQEKAIIWLLSQGDVLGKDFTLDNAVDYAENMAFYQEVKRRQSKSLFIDFSGDENCDEKCRGWDMSSHRCDCGNRRVDFIRSYDFSFEDPEIHAEAY